MANTPRFPQQPPPYAHPDRAYAQMPQPQHAQQPQPSAYVPAHVAPVSADSYKRDTAIDGHRRGNTVKQIDKLVLAHLQHPGNPQKLDKLQREVPALVRALYASDPARASKIAAQIEQMQAHAQMRSMQAQQAHKAPADQARRPGGSGSGRPSNGGSGSHSNIVIINNNGNAQSSGGNGGGSGGGGGGGGSGGGSGGGGS